MSNRVFSEALVVTRQPNDGAAGVYRVPARHRWVIKALTWCEDRPDPAGSGGYDLVVDVEWNTAEFGPLRMTVIQDSKLSFKRPGEWEGRIVLDDGDALILGNATKPYDSLHPVLISVHGYDFLNTLQGDSVHAEAEPIRLDIGLNIH